MASIIIRAHYSKKKSHEVSSMETEVFFILALYMSFSRLTCILLKRTDAYLAARQTKDLLIFLKKLFSNENITICVRFQDLR